MSGFWQKLKSFFGEKAPANPPRGMPDLYYRPNLIDIPPAASDPLPPSEADNYPRSIPPIISHDAVKPSSGGWVEGSVIVSKDATPFGNGYKRIGINYEDAKGDLSERVISIAQLRAADTPSDHSMIIAFCHSANAIRHFRVDRIKGFFDPDTGEVLTGAKLVADQAAFRIPSQDEVNDRHFLSSTLDELKKEIQEEVKKYGWFLEIEDFESFRHLACFRMAKRGNRRLKHPSITLYHEPFFMDPVYTPGGGTVTYKRGSARSKPWGVRADGETTRTFGSMEKAAVVFVEMAQKHAPVSAPPVK